MKIQFLKGERWYGGLCHHACLMPITERSTYTVDFATEKSNNQVNYLFLSDKGRYIRSATAYTIVFDNGEITIPDCVEYGRHGDTLREVTEYVHSGYHTDVTDVDYGYVLRPQYCTWIDMMYEQTEAGVLKYAESIVECGMPIGTILIDCGWQKYYGDWDFDRHKFPDPKGMVDKLHAMGFKVMLWMVPYVTADSIVFRKLKGKNCLLTVDGKPKLVEWWDGYSAIVDFINPEGRAWFMEQINYLKQVYYVDGIKLDGGDIGCYHLTGDYADAVKQCEAFSEMGAEIGVCEMRACYLSPCTRLLHRVADKPHDWTERGLKSFIPVMLMQNLMGYYLTGPDMVGGGEYVNFMSVSGRLDKELFVRHCQMAVLMPIIQFSHPIWRCDEATSDLIRKALSLRQSLCGYFETTFRECVTNHRPIMRSIAYQFDSDVEITDEYMIGDSLLVAPVLNKGETRKRVYLPGGEWRYGETTYQGDGYVEIDVDIESIPHFWKI